MANKTEKKVVKEATNKEERVNLFKTSYYFYRNWVKEILKNGKIIGFRFVKDADSWNGIISVPKPNVEVAQKVLSNYKTKNPETVDMWW